MVTVRAGDDIERARRIVHDAIFRYVTFEEGATEALDALGYLTAALDRLQGRLAALQNLADVTGNYLLWEPRQKGHADAHKRLWDAYREYEAACPLEVVESRP